MTHWAMVIDLNCCIGCKACIIACSHANDVPEGMWRKLKVLPDCPAPERERLSATWGCMHCEEPPCESVCPTGATFRRNDGIVEIDQKKCVGCGYCVLSCPYGARTIHRYRHTFEMVRMSDGVQENKSRENREGVCTKCNFCAERVDKGLNMGLKPGVDPDATPFCVVNCSSGALYFGDLDDPHSNVSKILQKRKAFRMFTGVETGPSVYYLMQSR